MMSHSARRTVKFRTTITLLPPTMLMTYSSSCTTEPRRMSPERARSLSWPANIAGQVSAPSETRPRHLSLRGVPLPSTLTQRRLTTCTMGLRFVSPASAAPTPFGVSLADAIASRWTGFAGASRSAAGWGRGGGLGEANGGADLKI
uniref:Uncharacterized protein n=1 Tax=Triticum urartu TaxID=4572 RepID=A0A8R7QRI1_TRIUA